MVQKPPNRVEILSQYPGGEAHDVGGWRDKKEEELVRAGRRKRWIRYNPSYEKRRYPAQIEDISLN